MNKEQINSDKKVLASLEAQYKDVQLKANSIRSLITDLNFEELLTDSQERCLMVDQLQAYDYLRTNLMNRIRFYRTRIKREDVIKDWRQYNKTDRYNISVDVSNEGDHSTTQHHCGQDADCDDACCQARDAGSPCGDSVAAKRRLPIDGFENVLIHDGNAHSEQCCSLKSLLGMQVLGIGKCKCDGCPQDHYETPCVKLELVGGAYLCLAPTPNTITE